MRHRSLFLCVLALLFGIARPSLAAAPHPLERIPLDTGWTVRQLPDDGMAESASATPPSGNEGWFAATVPGDVHLDLLHAGKIQDPFYRDNEAKLQWIEKVGWEYRTKIQITSQTLSRQNVTLVFDGLDTACTVFLNGQRIAAPDNMFRQWRIDVKSRLHEGTNDLSIVFPAPLKAAAAVAETDPWYPRTHTDIKGYIRKAVYEFGWDWGPRFATSGVWKPAYIEAWDEARIDDVFAEQTDVSAAVAHVDLHVDVLASDVVRAHVAIDYGLTGAPVHVERIVKLSPGVNRVTFPIEIDHPQRWWPAGYGAQPIYHFNVSVKDGATKLDSAVVKTGLRTVELRRQRDQWGRSFEFVVNGVPIYAKGADIIPFDSFPNRVTVAQIRHILESAKDSNMNMVRVWGGGYYQRQEFYDLCDQLGLMVFQDLMFGNNWQPGFYAFKQNIAREAEYQMVRLRNHPSIVIWVGNNETEELRDWNGNGQLPAAVHEHIWQDYLTEFSGILPTVEARVDPEIPYWPSTPSADYEEQSPTFQSGDSHDWSVWHQDAPFSAYEQHHWRFTSEFGFQSFPEMKTIESFTTPEDRASVFTPVMLEHQKNGGGNAIIERYMNRYYGQPKDFAHFLYASQVLQAEAVRVGAEFWRRERPRSMGTLYWQLNDCWPVASWSSIDYYGRWKALQYYARRFYASTLVSPHIDNGVLEIYIVSDKTAQQNGELDLRVMRFDGTVVKQVRQAVNVPPLSSGIFVRVPLDSLQEAGVKLDPATVFASMKLTIDGKEASSNSIYFVPTIQVKLPPPQIQSKLTRSGTGFDLELSSPVLEKSVLVSFGDLDTELSDNYFDILPGQTVHIHVATAASEEKVRAAMNFYTLNDAFVPAPVGKGK